MDESVASVQSTIQMEMDPSPSRPPVDYGSVWDEKEQLRRLGILESLVEQRKKCRNDNVVAGEVGSVPLFTELIRISFDPNPVDNKKQEEEEENNDIKMNVSNDPKEEVGQSSVVVEKPSRMIIDVDVELGLKSRTSPKIILNSSVVPSSLSSRIQPSLVVKPEQKSTTTTTVLSPQEEGFYEGVVSPMSLPEDSLYLSDLHCWTRQHLELFSATTRDLALVSGRRGNSSVVVGKVGIRCRHCAAHSSHPQFTWPLAAISFPFNRHGIYSACSQKPNFHFHHCPYLPIEEKNKLKLFTTTQQDPWDTNRPNKRLKTGIPAPVYYAIAAKRIGIIDVEDGMRFGRDLSLEPLPFEIGHAQLLQDERLVHNHDTARMTDSVRSGTISHPNVTTTRLDGDEDSERVLAEAVAEPDFNLLGRSGDKSLVSDYLFLILRQMAICHALPTDFGSRGKRTKSMHVGLAGFCCRHCLAGRSFGSAPDNLASAATISLVAHLNKCPAVPQRIKKALAAYRKIHTKQMTQLPYGSQRRMFHEIWARLRAADKTLQEMEPLLSSLQTTTTTTTTAALPMQQPMDTEINHEADSGVVGGGGEEQENANGGDDPEFIPDSPPKSAAAPVSSMSLEQYWDSTPVGTERRADFPVSNNPETIAVLQKFIQNWDPAVNDFLIVPEDKNLVSDYVFLTMRQIKVAIPQASDVPRMRRGPDHIATIPGLCCLHCAHANYAVTPTGRSFLSAPDNFASSLNSSFYNHMQSCPFISVDLKRALADTRKLHSAQCSSLKFGSQRRYFNTLFDRLKNFQGGTFESTTIPSPVAETTTTRQDPSLAYFHLPSISKPTLFVCRQCHMVPMPFRAPGSVFRSRPTQANQRDHKMKCQGSRLDLTLAVESFCAAASSIGKDPLELMKMESFQSVLQLVAGPELVAALSEGIPNALQMKLHTNLQEYSTERMDLWMYFGRQPNYGEVQQAFYELVTHLQCGSGDLKDYPDFNAFLLLVCPGLETNQKEEESLKVSFV